ncbi:hypothetical protein [Crateriforma conspicua]|uniref:hypothetical protein n=1 Tax=Crateriforma conspicua TaxID=2527996 RepID=UPI001187BDDA|nr:hypothetical protein [Crateriforma conspicua]QDV62782.1 hypothetical protein Mal65_19180 [Crateriforma conspicua]
MSASNRAKLIEKLHKALKKNYKVPPTQPSRPLLEHVLYASLLEDCPADLADEGMAKLEQDFFDWNEVRVTTISELAQVLGRLPDPIRAASRLKGNLQAIFEEFYTFDLDHLKKENLGKAVKKFSEMPSMSSFVLGYTVQHGLGGHSIPLDYSAMVVMLVCGIASTSEASTGKVPGLERAIPKSKGLEFCALLHQCAVDLNQNAKDKTAMQTLVAVDKNAEANLKEWLSSKKEARKRAAERKAEEKEAAREKAKAEAESAQRAAIEAAAKKSASASRRTKKTASQPSAAEQAAAEQAAAAKKAASKSKSKSSRSSKAKSDKPKAETAKSKDSPTKTSSTKDSTTKSSSSTKSASSRKSTSKSTAKKKSSTTPDAGKKPAKTKSSSTGDTKSASKKAAKKSSSRKLSKRKPR